MCAPYTMIKAALRSATRWAKRDPWLLAVVALLVAIVLIVVKMREGWAFLDDPRELPFNEKDQPDHYALIRKYCSRGVSIEQIMKEKPEWDWLAKYSEQDLRRACYSNRTKQLSQTVLDLPESQELNKLCKNGRKPCPRADLKRERPCMNRDETKCCNPDGKDCLEIDHDTGLRNAWYERVRKLREQQPQPAKATGCKNNFDEDCFTEPIRKTKPYTYRGCLYTDKYTIKDEFVTRHGGQKTACPKGYRKETQYNFPGYRCAKNPVCIEKLFGRCGPRDDCGLGTDGFKEG